MEERKIRADGAEYVRLRNRTSGRMIYWGLRLVRSLIVPDQAETLRKKGEKADLNAAGRPSKALREKFNFTEETRYGYPVFHLSGRDGGEKNLHILYLHGGAWVFNLQSMQWPIPAGMAEEFCADVTVPIYPLAPKATWKESMDFVKAVYCDMAASYGSDKIIITGDSAGGGMALLLAQALRDDGFPQPYGVVLWSPVLDLTASDPKQVELARKSDGLVTLDLIRNAGAIWAGSLDPADPRVSALFAYQSDLAPIITFTGDCEVLEADSRRLKEQNPAVKWMSYAEMQHIFPAYVQREGQHAIKEAATFLREKHTGRL